MTYYKYVDRQAGNQVDWSAISKDLSQTLTDEVTRREELKQQIDEETRAYAEELQNAPSGDFKTANEFALEYAENAQQAMLTQERLLKSGLLKVKDYTVKRQNLRDGTQTMFKLAQEYQDEYKLKMDRYKAGDSQAFEAWVMQQAEGLANLKNTGAYIDPTSYQISIAKKVYNKEKGVWEMSKSPNEFVTVHQLRNRMKQTFDRFDVDKNLKQKVDSLGEYNAVIRKIGSQTKAGTITEITDYRNRPDIADQLSPDQKAAIDKFNEMKNQMVNQFFSYDMNLMSVLTDYMGTDPETGEAYEPTFDPKQAKESSKYILMKDDGSGSVSMDENAPNYQKQREGAANAIKNQFDNMMDQKEKVQVYNEPRPYVPSTTTSGGYTKEEKKDMGVMVAKLYYGNENDIKSAEEYLKGMFVDDAGNPLLKDITRTDEGLTIITNNEGKEFISFTDSNGKPVSISDFVKKASSFLTGDTDVFTVLQKDESYDPNKTLSIHKKSITSRTVSMKERADNAIDASLSVDMFNNKSNSDVIDDIQSVVSALGFRAKKTVRMGGWNDIDVLDKDGNIIATVNTNSTDPKKQYDILVNALKGQSSDASKENFLQIFGEQENSNPNPNPDPNTKPGGGKYDPAK